MLRQSRQIPLECGTTDPRLVADAKGSPNSCVFFLCWDSDGSGFSGGGQEQKPKSDVKS